MTLYSLLYFLLKQKVVGEFIVRWMKLENNMKRVHNAFFVQTSLVVGEVRNVLLLTILV